MWLKTKRLTSFTAFKKVKSVVYPISFAGDGVFLLAGNNVLHIQFPLAINSENWLIFFAHPENPNIVYFRKSYFLTAYYQGIFMQ